MARVAVLGCGPAGLIVAHSAIEAGHDVSIYSRKIASPMNGAMYLHAPIPGLTEYVDDPDFVVHVIKLGNRQTYADNVYGDPDHSVSWDKLDASPVPAWSLRNTYAAAWSRYSDLIQDTPDAAGITSFLKDAFDVIVSTIPAPALCLDPRHKFYRQSIAVVQHPILNVGPNMMIYNGTYDPERMPWYRFSIIENIASWEFRVGAGFVDPDIQSLNPKQGFKPQSTDCDCHPEIVRMGRYGKWTRDVLVHHAWEEAQACFAATAAK